MDTFPLQGHPLHGTAAPRRSIDESTSEKLVTMAHTNDNPWSAMEEGGSPWDGECIPNTSIVDGEALG